MEARQGEGEHILEITKEFKDTTVEIQVRDTGIGMSQQVAKRAFESFFTTKEIGKGTTVIIRIPVRPQKNLITSGDGRMDFAI